MFYKSNDLPIMIIVISRSPAVICNPWWENCVYLKHDITEAVSFLLTFSIISATFRGFDVFLKFLNAFCVINSCLFKGWNYDKTYSHFCLMVCSNSCAHFSVIWGLEMFHFNYKCHCSDTFPKTISVLFRIFQAAHCEHFHHYYFLSEEINSFDKRKIIYISKWEGINCFIIFLMAANDWNSF